MFNYIEKSNTIHIKELENNRFSFCPKDYRKFDIPTKNIKPLKEFMILKENVGSEIGSNSYIKNSKYRFLKTTNIQDNYLVFDLTCERCIPGIGTQPINDSIFIAKDGGGEGLGSVAYYKSNNSENDYISSGVLNIKVVDKYKYYILAFLKSKHFKTFVDLNTPEGSTIRHSKKIALDYPIVVPNDEILSVVSEKVKCLIEKEKIIVIKHNEIDELINAELNLQNTINYSRNTTIQDIKKNFSRLDAGMYGDEYKKLNAYISNYKNGTYCIPIENIKSGSTPKIRVLSETSKYCWVTPTDISDYGFLNYSTKINMPTSNNLNKDSLLFINRTSKGGKGEYVGICMFYDKKYYGIGHHNQGIYRVDKYDRNELLFIASFMNSTIMRKICSKVSYGTKMRELKAIDFSKFLIPKFPDDRKHEIIAKYYCNDDEYIIRDKFDEYEIKHDNKIGIYQLEQEIKVLKKDIDNIIHELIIKSL